MTADLDTVYDQTTAALAPIEEAILDPAQRSEALLALGEIVQQLGGTVSVLRTQSNAPATRDYSDGTGGNPTEHAATAESMRDLAAAIRSSAEPAEGAMILATVLRHIPHLVAELVNWNGAQARVAAEMTKYRDGMTRDQVLAYLAQQGREIRPGTWSAYVARSQAPAPARRIERTPLWDPQDIAAFAAGTWKASA